MYLKFPTHSSGEQCKEGCGINLLNYLMMILDYTLSGLTAKGVMPLAQSLFLEQPVLFSLNVISDESDCGPDASTYLLCVSFAQQDQKKITGSYKSFKNNFHQSLCVTGHK